MAPMAHRHRPTSQISPFDSEKDEPGNRTSPGVNISIKVSYGDEDWEDPFEEQGKTDVGGFGDTDPGTGSAPPRRAGARGPDGFQTYDEKKAWGGRSLGIDR